MFRLRTLGGLALEHDGVTVDAVGGQRKTLALLALLAAARQRGISRDRLAAYLWPESDTDRARGALKQALHVVRRHLGTDAIQGGSALRLNANVITTDLDGFLGALEAGELERAEEAYAGTFLDGFFLSGSPEFDEWLESERAELARRYATVLEQLARTAEARRDAYEAIRWWRRLQSADPLSDRVILGLMQALEAAGDRAAALQCAQEHESVLRERLGSGLSPAVSALAERMRQAPAAVHPPAAAPHPDTRPSLALATPDGRLTPDGPPPAVPAAARRTGTAMMLGAGLLVLILTGLVLQQRAARRAAPAGERSVAVLPFENASADPAGAHLAEGLAEEMTAELRTVPGLRIAPRAAAAALRARGLSSRAIAESLGVAAVLEGQVERRGERLRLRVRLRSARDGRLLWGESYDREAGDLLVVQGEVASALRTALQVQIAGPLRPARRTSDPEAYDLFLRARHSWKRRDREGLERAVAFYEQAVERDPEFAAAYAGLAEAYVNLSNFAYRPPEESLTRAQVAADRAIQLDAQLAEAHAARGFVLASRLRLPEAEAAFRHAIDLNPDYGWAHHYYTLLLLMLDRTQEAAVQNREALRIDPLSLPANATRGIILCQRGDYPAARRELERALALSPEFPLALYYLGVVRTAQGHLEEGGALLRRARERAPGWPGGAGALAYLHDRSGRAARADSILAELRGRSEDPRTRANLAFALAALGRLDEAFPLLEELAWDIPTVIELRADPLLRSVRADARYPGLLRRMGVDRGR